MIAVPKLSDSRRLTGANLYWQQPAAIIDCAGEGDLGPFIGLWQDAVERLLSLLDRAESETTVRTFDGGASLLISAPVDALYSMCEVNEVAFAQAQALAAGADLESLDDDLERLRQEFAEEANPPLLALQAEAKRQGVPFLWDDDAVSVGYGATALVWTPDALPATDEVPWAEVGTIPVALVTGTNGKSTTVRMAAAILSAAGLRAGLTSTDWIRVGENILDTGDYSGTGGARTLLRHPDTQIAVLETARGGMLRRGLGVDSASGALITNVAADHLGDYGINTVPELIEAKFIVRRALQGEAPLLLNADDAGVVAFSESLDQPLGWFSLEAGHPLVEAQRASAGPGAFLRDGELVLLEHGTDRPLMRADEIPAALEGAARHNIANALAAALLCQVLGIDLRHIREGLAAFRGDAGDNPGRNNWFEKDGVRILVDFAHNEHGMLALADMLRRVPAERRFMLMSQAGDRLDGDIRDMTRAACGISPDRLFLCDLPGYERGRAPGEVIQVIRSAALSSGVAENQISEWPNPRAAVAAALDAARPGDLLVLFVLTQRDEVLSMIHHYLDGDAAGR